MTQHRSTPGKKPVPPKRPTGRPLASRVLEQSGAASWEWETRSNRARFAEQWRDILAVPKGQPLGRDPEFLARRMRDPDRTLFLEVCQRIASGEADSLDMPLRLKRYDNTWVWMLLRGGLISAPGRQFSGLGITVSRLRLDKRFAPPSHDDTNATYQVMLDNSPMHIMRFDRELFPCYMNPAMQRFLPYDENEMGELKASEIGLTPAALHFLQERVDQVFETAEVVRFQWTLPTPEQGLIVGDLVLWPELDSEGRVKSVISQFFDRTAELQREKEALLTELRFSSLYELAQMDDMPEEAVIRFVVEKIAELTDSEYSHLHFMPGALREEAFIVWSESHFSLFTREELGAVAPGRIRADFGIDPDTSEEPREPIMRNRHVPGFKGTLLGRRMAITRFLAAPAIEEGEMACVAAVYNKTGDYTSADMRQLELFMNGAWHILRRRHYVEALKIAKERAETASLAKNRFLAAVSHELRTPLNGLLSMLQLLEYTSLTTEQTEYTQRANQSGGTLMRIISDILDYSRMESGKFQLDLAPFDLKATLRSIVQDFASQAEERGLALYLTLNGDFPALVLGDEARVRQVLYNLVGNSLKFTEAGEVEVTCAVEWREDGSALFRLAVRDTGIGIPPEMQRSVFEAFTQVEGSGARRHQGSGLGLGIVRQLIQHMDGKVTLESTPGKGTLITCVVCLPVVSHEDPAGNTASGAGQGPEIPARTLTVLVAEDDAVSRFAMNRFLTRLGYRAVCVGNGLEALEALRLYAFDCLVSDVLMPEMDGIEVTRRIREERLSDVIPSLGIRELVASTLPEIRHTLPRPGDGLLSPARDLPIAAVSAHAMQGDREYLLEQGMDFYLSKPVRSEDLEAVLLQIQERTAMGL